MITVLLVHDNTELIEGARSYLAKMGEVRVDAVHSVKQALEILKNRNYDIIVSYYQIPEVNGIEFMDDMNGIELLRFLKSQGSTSPFILYSRRGDRLVLEDLNAAGESPLPRGSSRPQVVELRDLVHQAVMRKKVERDLSARCESLDAILNATPLWVCQMHSSVLDWVNAAMTRGLGYEKGALAGKSALSLFPDKEECDRAFREMTIRVDEEGWGFSDTRMKKQDGTVIPCRTRIRLADLHDHSRGQVMVCEDQSERFRLEETVKESDLRYREMLQNSSSIIMKLDPEGTVTFFNKFAQSFFGYSAPEILGKNVVGTLIPEGRRNLEVTGFVQDMHMNGDGSAIRINEMILRDGEPVWIAWVNKAVREPDGHIREIVCIGHDITDHACRDRRRISTAMWKDRVISGTDITDEVFDAVFNICLEIAKEGREGKQLGTAFIIGDTENVLQKSKQLILNPFAGHRTEDRMIVNHDIKENVKELAQLDGAFVVRGDGLIEAAARYITIDTHEVGIQKGLGTRHSSVAAITMVTAAIGIVVSQSGGKISIFRNGRMMQEIA